MKLSFILPIFNTGKYLQKCIDSTLAQNLPAEDFEVRYENLGRIIWRRLGEIDGIYIDKQFNSCDVLIVLMIKNLIRA